MAVLLVNLLFKATWEVFILNIEFVLMSWKRVFHCLAEMLQHKDLWQYNKNQLAVSLHKNIWYTRIFDNSHSFVARVRVGSGRHKQGHWWIRNPGRKLYWILSTGLGCMVKTWEVMHPLQGGKGEPSGQGYARACVCVSASAREVTSPPYSLLFLPWNLPPLLFKNGTLA